MKRKHIYCYIDGVKLRGEIIQMALNNNMMVKELKDMLIKEYEGHKVTFEIV